MAIYRSNYLGDHKFPITTGTLFEVLKEGFTGGATDMYVPYSDEPVYVYDINSLYPWIMALFELPVGFIRYFKGDIRKVEPNAYGFFYCKITSPEYLHKPILQTRVETPNGVRTVAGLGT